MTQPKIGTFVFSKAVRHFWESRDSQSRKQAESGNSDQGNRSAITGGKHMDGFLATIVELLTAANVRKNDIYCQKDPTELPGYFRPNKEWDLVVVVDGNLVAAIEGEKGTFYFFRTLSIVCVNRVEKSRMSPFLAPPLRVFPAVTMACADRAGVAQLVEHQPSKLLGTILDHVSTCKRCAEHVLACANLRVVAHEVGTEGRHTALLAGGQKA